MCVWVCADVRVYLCVCRLKGERGLFLNDENCSKGTQQNWHPPRSPQLFLPYSKRANFINFVWRLQEDSHSFMDVYYEAVEECVSRSTSGRLSEMYKYFVAVDFFRYLYFTRALIFFTFYFYPRHFNTNICTIYSSWVRYFSFNAFSQDHKTDFNLSACHAADTARWNNPERERSEWGEKAG